MRMMLFLVNISIYFQGSAGHVYVEVVLHGETEGKFLEDPDAHTDETMGQVSKLGRFWQCVATRETDHLPYRNLQSIGPAPT